MPCSVKAPIRIAVVESPGMPSESSGTSAPPVKALLEDSEETIPCGAPLPIWEESREKFFSWL